MFTLLKRHRWEIEQREPYAGETDGIITMVGYRYDRERMDMEKEKQKADAASRRGINK